MKKKQREAAEFKKKNYFCKKDSTQCTLFAKLCLTLHREKDYHIWEE